MKNSWKVFNRYSSYAAFAAAVAIGVALFFKMKDRTAPVIFLYACIAAVSAYWLMGSLMVIWYAFLEGMGILRAKLSMNPTLGDVAKTAFLMSITAVGAAVGGPLTVYLTSDEHNAKIAARVAAADSSDVLSK